MICPIGMSPAPSIELNFDRNHLDFEFIYLEDLMNGLGADGEYQIYGYVNANTSWELQMMASPFLHSNGINEIDLNNVGIEIKFTGKNKVKNWAKNRVIPLNTYPSLMISKQGSHSNAGKENNNSFYLLFEMGTKRQNMNKKNLKEQNIKSGEYQTQVTFIISQYMGW